VTLMPIASFLAGSLLSLLLPVLLLLALLAWFDLLFRRHGEPADVSDLGRSGAEASGTGADLAPSEGPGAAGGPQPPGGP
jgi:hypothetical protein